MMVGRNLIAGRWSGGASETEDRDPPALSDPVGARMKASRVHAGPAT
jgi:hypothetical protein